MSDAQQSPSSSSPLFFGAPRPEDFLPTPGGFHHASSHSLQEQEKRQQLLEHAVRFLSNTPSTSSPFRAPTANPSSPSPTATIWTDDERKREFLRRKGLTESDIDEAFRRSASGTSLRRSAAESSSSAAREDEVWPTWEGVAGAVEVQPSPAPASAPPVPYRTYSRSPLALYAPPPPPPPPPPSRYQTLLSFFRRLCFTLVLLGGFSMMGTLGWKALFLPFLDKSLLARLSLLTHHSSLYNRILSTIRDLRYSGLSSLSPEATAAAAAAAAAKKSEEEERALRKPHDGARPRLGCLAKPGGLSGTQNAFGGSTKPMKRVRWRLGDEEEEDEWVTDEEASEPGTPRGNLGMTPLDVAKEVEKAYERVETEAGSVEQEERGQERDESKTAEVKAKAGASEGEEEREVDARDADGKDGGQASETDVIDPGTTERAPIDILHSWRASLSGLVAALRQGSPEGHASRQQEDEGEERRRREGLDEFGFPLAASSSSPSLEPKTKLFDSLVNLESYISSQHFLASDTLASSLRDAAGAGGVSAFHNPWAAPSAPSAGKASGDGEGEIVSTAKIRAEIRALKGLLLNRRNFPAFGRGITSDSGGAAGAAGAEANGRGTLRPGAEIARQRMPGMRGGQPGGGEAAGR